MTNTILDDMGAFWAALAAILPRIALALVVLLVGWMVAAIVRRLAVKLLRRVKLDVVSERAGIEGFLIQGGVRFTAASLVAWFIYWLLILSAISLALSIVGVGIADELMRRTLLYIPNVVVAVLLFSLGALFARFVRGALAAYLNNVGVEAARPISAIAQWAILIFVATIALEQLGIGGDTLTAAFKMAFGGLCLAFGLAFGLGGRRWAQAILEKVWKP